MCCVALRERGERASAPTNERTNDESQWGGQTNGELHSVAQAAKGVATTSQREEEEAHTTHTHGAGAAGECVSVCVCVCQLVCVQLLVLNSGRRICVCVCAFVCAIVLWKQKFYEWVSSIQLQLRRGGGHSRARTRRTQFNTALLALLLLLSRSSATLIHIIQACSGMRRA